MELRQNHCKRDTIASNMVCSIVNRYLVFHGGSGSTKEEIETAVKNGVVKMNVDTDTQFAYLAGIRVYILNFAR